MGSLTLDSALDLEKSGLQCQGAQILRAVTACARLFGCQCDALEVLSTLKPKSWRKRGFLQRDRVLTVRYGHIAAAGERTRMADGP